MPDTLPAWLAFGLLLVGIWIACGVAAADVFYRTLQHHAPDDTDEGRQIDRDLAVCFGLWGPLAMLVIVWERDLRGNEMWR